MSPEERPPLRPVVLSVRCVCCGAVVRRRELVFKRWCSLECVHRDALVFREGPHLEELLAGRPANDNREVGDDEA